jgi:hypothetical protein
MSIQGSDETPSRKTWLRVGRINVAAEVDKLKYCGRSEKVK